MGNGLTSNHAFTLADILGVDMVLDTREGTVTGSGSFKAKLGDLVIDFPLDVAGGAGGQTGAFVVARSRGNLLIIAGRSTRSGRTLSLCAFVDVALQPQWRAWLTSTKARTYEAALRELGKAVVCRFQRTPASAWAPAA